MTTLTPDWADRWNAGRPAAQPRPGNSDAALLTLDWSTF